MDVCVCVFTGEGKMGVMVLANALLVCNSVCYSPPMLDCCHYHASGKHTHTRTYSANTHTSEKEKNTPGSVYIIIDEVAWT